MHPSLPPHSLAPVAFRFRALAALAGRAPMGGNREVALACFLAARLVHDAIGSDAIPLPAREARAQGARSWLASTTVPAAVRVPLARLMEAAGQADRAAMHTALSAVTAITAPHLDAASHSELTQLVQAIVA